MAKGQSQFSMIWGQLKKNRTAILGGTILIIIVAMVLLAPLIAPYDYAEQNRSESLQGISSKHLLGTDNLGRDLLSRLLYGGRISLLIGVGSTVLSAVIGMAIGIPAGYFGGKTDILLMRFIDIYSSIPSLALSIALSSVLGPGVGNCIVALGVSNIGSFARMIRIQFLSARGEDYVEAARAINCTDLKTIFKYILPNTIAPLLVNFTMSIGTNIMAAASLSFIGLGAQPPIPEWGAILSEGRQFMRGHMNLVMCPGICIMLVALSTNLFGDGLRDALDPKLRH